MIKRETQETTIENAKRKQMLGPYLYSDIMRILFILEKIFYLVCKNLG